MTVAPTAGTAPAVEAVLVAVGGATGAAARYVVGLRLDGRRATAVVNVLGSLLLGAVVGAVTVGSVPSSAALVVGTGFCGAFTTYSSLAVETQSLLADGRLWTAAQFALGTLVVALAGAVLGGWLVRLVVGF